MCLPIEMVVAYDMDPLKAVMTSGSSLHQPPLMVRRKRVGESARSDSNFAESNRNTIHGKEEEVNDDTVGAVHYKISTNKESQVRQHVCISQHETPPPKAEW